MKQLNQLTDAGLLALLNRDDEAAFTELYNRYWSRLYAAAYKRVKSPEIAEEIVQDLFTGIWKKRKTLHIATSCEAYLFTAVRYLVLHHLEKRSVRENYKNALRVAHRDEDNSTQETILLDDLSRQVEEALAALPARCRSVFELSRKAYKTNREIAAELGISEKTVEHHLTKALARIRLSLQAKSLLLLLLFFIR